MNEQNLNLEISASEISTKESVYIIIPVYNRKATTLKCLKHLQDCGNLKQYHVVVIDDGSTDGTTEAILNSYPEVEILEGNGDLWWTGAIAKGMEYAHQQGAQYFVWLNDDCLPATSTLSKMVQFMRSHSNTLVAPSCYAQTSNSRKIQHNGFRGRQGCAAKSGEILEVEGMSGWCVGIPATVYQKIGAPDAKKFPHYSGDDIYTLQATKAGFQAYLVGDLEATLVGGVHENLTIQNYFKPGLTPIDTFKALFLDKKSPYRLATRFFVLIERYSMFIGIITFVTKFFIWTIQWLKFQIKTAILSK